MASNNPDPLFFLMSFSVLPPYSSVAFVASNYRLYQSYISPYGSPGPSKHLKGQLIALWQAWLPSLKEKSRSGQEDSPLFLLAPTQCPSLSLSVRTILCLFSSFLSLCFFSSVSAGSISSLCHHTCHFNEQKRNKNAPPRPSTHASCICLRHQR